PATGVVDYRYVTVPLDIHEDKWVRAVEYRPTGRGVLHHMVAFTVAPELLGKSVGEQMQSANLALRGYTPGKEPFMAPPDTGSLIKKGSSVLLSLHYTTNGKATSDETEIGVYF